jgi:8-oxo-dGTP diphosphatase
LAVRDHNTGEFRLAKPVTPLLSVDAVIFDARDRLLLIRRKYPPFQGSHALPGGFVDVGEAVEDACRRELFEEAGLKVGVLALVGVYSEPNRDPRGHNVSVAFVGTVGDVEPVAGDDAASAEWVADWRNVDFAFDHKLIVMDAERRR